MDSVEYRLLIRVQGKHKNDQKYINAETDEEAVKYAIEYAKKKNAEIRLLTKTVKTVSVLISND